MGSRYAWLYGRGALAIGGWIGVKPRVTRGPSNRQFEERRWPSTSETPSSGEATRLGLGALTVRFLGRSVRGSEESRPAPLPAVCRIKAADLRDVLVRGLDDFAAYRTDVIFLCLIYPIVGSALAWVTFGYEMLQLLFPLALGFALFGPVAAGGSMK